MTFEAFCMYENQHFVIHLYWYARVEYGENVSNWAKEELLLKKTCNQTCNDDRTLKSVVYSIWTRKYMKKLWMSNITIM